MQSDEVLWVMSILLTWLGNVDLRASEAQDLTGEGPILGAISALSFNEVHLLSDHGVSSTDAQL